MKIYELRYTCHNFGTYEDHCSFEKSTGFYVTKELAENALSNLDILQISDFEFPKLIKELDQRELDEKNRMGYYIPAKSDLLVYHNYIRGAKILDACDDIELVKVVLSDDYIPPLDTWCFLFEVVEHELIGS